MIFQFDNLSSYFKQRKFPPLQYESRTKIFHDCRFDLIYIYQVWWPNCWLLGHRHILLQFQHGEGNGTNFIHWQCHNIPVATGDKINWFWHKILYNLNRGRYTFTNLLRGRGMGKKFENLWLKNESKSSPTTSTLLMSHSFVFQFHLTWCEPSVSS